MAITFDANRAWDEAVRMIKANRELILVLAGIFLFLPPLAAYVLVPEIALGPVDLDPDNPVPAITAFFERTWPALLLLQFMQAIGTLAILALVTQRRPTVAEAMKAGLTALVPLIAAQIILGLLVVFGLSLVLSLAAALGALAVTITSFAAIILMLFLFARFSPLMPVLVFEEIRNPLAAIARSWRMTGGQTGKLMRFLALVMIAMIVVMLVAGLVETLATAVLDGSGGMFLAGLVSALVGAVLSTITALILAAIYRQLVAGETARSAADEH